MTSFLNFIHVISQSPVYIAASLLLNLALSIVFARWARENRADNGRKVRTVIYVSLAALCVVSAIFKVVKLTTFIGN